MEILIIGCDMYPELPMTVEIKTIKGGFSFVFFCFFFLFLFFGKFIIIWDFFFFFFFLKFKECYSTLLHIKFPELQISQNFAYT